MSAFFSEERTQFEIGGSCVMIFGKMARKLKNHQEPRDCNKLSFHILVLLMLLNF